MTVQAFYLDSDLWSSYSFPLQIHHEPVPDEISLLLGNEADIDYIKSHYFHTIHTWMPIISKIRLDRLMERTRGSTRADTALLLLCMKLVQDTALPKLYTTTARFLYSLQTKRILTLRIVQAGLLLSVYELGHGIFPSAFITVGHSARSAVALGLHNKLAPQLAGRPRSWMDWEERQRVWWMVVILDR